MRMKKAVLALLAGGLLLPVAGFADRLNGDFQTEDSSTGEANEACTEVDFDDFSVRGLVSATNGNCLVTIEYVTEFPHKASATALKSGKQTGTAKISQSTETFIELTIEDDGLLDCPLANEYEGDAIPEKCKASSSMKGTANAAPTEDTVDSAKISVSCDLGEGGSALGPVAPDATQFDTATAAFGERQDVKFDSKGTVKITHDGIADSSSPVFCN